LNKQIISLIGRVALLGGLAVYPVAFASDSADVTKVLAGFSVLELPSKAADIVAKASSTNKEDLAAAVVKTALGINPSADLAIVSAVAGENPTVAPVVAVTAAALQHKRIGLIAKAVAAAAPSEAARIVAAMIKEFPQDYGVIATAAAEGAPSAGRKILTVVGDLVPALKTSIQTATANFTANNVPVQAILSQSYHKAMNSGVTVSIQVPPALSPSILGSPYAPPASNIVTSGRNQVAPGTPAGFNSATP
jgi:hypothetical protein